MSREDYQYKARINAALEHAVISHANRMGCGRAEAGRQLMHLGAGLPFTAVSVRPAWPDKTLDAIGIVARTSHELLSASQQMRKEDMAPPNLVNAAYDIYHQLQSIRETLTDLNAEEVEALRQQKCDWEEKSRQGDGEFDLVLKLLNRLGI